MNIPRAVYWFTFQDYEALELVIRIMRELDITELRTAFSWADWERQGGPEWFDRFTQLLAEAGITIMPCLFYTPPHKARTKNGGEPRTSFPPRRIEDFADFTEAMIERYGRLFQWIQLWNESNWDVYWSWEMDPGWRIFAAMLKPAIAVAKRGGKKIVLGGLSPFEIEWTDAMFRYGIMQEADALGIHAFPGTWDAESERRKGRPWRGLDAEIEDAKSYLAHRDSKAQVWLTETGYSTYGEGAARAAREQKQIEYFDELLRCPADRVFWHTLLDQRSDAPTDNELNSGLSRDDKAYHFGLVDGQGRAKPLYSHWKALAAKEKLT